MWPLRRSASKLRQNTDTLQSSVHKTRSNCRFGTFRKAIYQFAIEGDPPVLIIESLHLFVRHKLQRSVCNSKHARNETLQRADKEIPTPYLLYLRVSLKGN